MAKALAHIGSDRIGWALVEVARPAGGSHCACVCERGLLSDLGRLPTHPTVHGDDAAGEVADPHLVVAGGVDPACERAAVGPGKD